MLFFFNRPTSVLNIMCFGVLISHPFMLPPGGPRLKCSDLLKHVIEVLQNSYSCSAYGDDYSSLLVKNILSVRKYWCDIPPQQWHGQSVLLRLLPSNVANSIVVTQRETLCVCFFTRCLPQICWRSTATCSAPRPSLLIASW